MAPGPIARRKVAGVEGAGADFHVVRLQQGATLRVPVLLQRQDDLLKCEHIVVLLAGAGKWLVL